MEIKKQISDNLWLEYTDSWYDNDFNLIGVFFEFWLYDQRCVAVFTFDRISKRMSSSSEAPYDLHDSFLDLIEDFHFDEIKEYFIKQIEHQRAEDEE